MEKISSRASHELRALRTNWRDHRSLRGFCSTETMHQYEHWRHINTRNRPFETMTHLLIPLDEEPEITDVGSKKELLNILEKYLSHMTTKPGKCKLCEYKFKVEADKYASFLRSQNSFPALVRALK